MGEVFENFPRGLAVVELNDPRDVSTWRLVAINGVASSLVVPSIDTFLSGEHLRVGAFVDLPNLYRDVITRRRARTVGMAEVRGNEPNHQPLYMVSAFPAGERRVALLFEDAHFFVSGRSARAQAERQLAQTCEFVGAILWRAEPETLRFTFVSPQAQAILGYWTERWTGETDFWRKHLFPDDCERVAAVCEKIVRERSRQDFEFRMASVQGQILWFHAAAEIVEQPNRPPELVGVMNDITDLKRAEERIRALSSRLMRLQDDERRHISRELHDSLGQYLTSIKMNLEMVKREGTSMEERHRALLEESAETLEKCVQEVRSVSYVLHPPLLDELGLLAALRWYTAGFAERSGIEVNLNAPSVFSRLPSEMELALFRIVQESLTNVQRHSGSASAWVTLSEHKDRAEIRITDSGEGIPAHVIERITRGKTIEGIGLRGMHERVRELGGRLEVESTGMGTAVYAVLPLRPTDANQRDGDDGEERKSRVAGKPLESAELRIENELGGAKGAGAARGAEGRGFPSARPRHRHTSRRST
jgi:PAS domain S-box-containing protein